MICVCWSNTPTWVQQREAQTWKPPLSRGHHHGRWTGVPAVTVDSRHHRPGGSFLPQHNRMCDPGETGRDRRLIVALWCWSWESSRSKSDKISLLQWLLCHTHTWIISLNWAALHTDYHGDGCVVSSRHQPRPRGGAVGAGGERRQLPGERQRVGAWSLCTLPIVSIPQTALVNRKTWLWHQNMIYMCSWFVTLSLETPWAPALASGATIHILILNISDSLSEDWTQQWLSFDISKNGWYESKAIPVVTGLVYANKVRVCSFCKVSRDQREQTVVLPCVK